MSKLSQEVMDKRRILYAELRERYLMEEWNGAANEISDTLDFYEESVIHYGLFDIGWTFLMDELENYGAYDLIERIREIVEEEDDI
jgi:hypothetical protein